MNGGPDSGGPEFPPAARERLAALAAKALGEVPGGDALTAAGGSDAAKPVAATSASPGWTIVQRVDDPDLERAREQMREDVEQGATGLSLVFAGAPNAYGYGLPPTPEALNAILGDLRPGRLHLRIDAHPTSRTTAELLAALLVRKRADITRLSLSFGIDPAAIFAGTGALRMSIAALQASMPQSLGHFFALGAPGILLEADGRVFHNAGATEAQELGVMMASAALYLRMFSEARQPLVYAVPHIGFSLSVDQDQFLSTVKVRALRELWTKMQESHGVKPVVATVHAETSYRMMMRLDPETNTLRSAIACLAAIAGGANTISILPHTITHGLPDGFARRVARNTQIMMADETLLGIAADPDAHSNVTGTLCTEAWAEFQRIESEGGVLQSLSDGHIQKRITVERDARIRRYRDGERGAATAFAQQTRRPVRTLEATTPAVAQESAATCEPLPLLRIDELMARQA